MNYFGGQLQGKETEFLKRALSDLAEKCRFGGKCSLAKRGFLYEDEGRERWKISKARKKYQPIKKIFIN